MPFSFKSELFPPIKTKIQPRHHIGNCSSHLKKQKNRCTWSYSLFQAANAGYWFAAALLSACPRQDCCSPGCNTTSDVKQLSHNLGVEPYDVFKAFCLVLRGLPSWCVGYHRRKAVVQVSLVSIVYLRTTRALCGCLHHRAPAPRSPFSAKLGSVAGCVQNFWTCWMYSPSLAEVFYFIFFLHRDL